MTQINVDVFKKAGFSFEEIESVKRGLDDVENGRFYDEKEFYSRLEKRLFTKNSACV